MSWIQALLLGLLQGLTEYLPVSSSGHLAIGQALFGLRRGQALMGRAQLPQYVFLIYIVVFHVLSSRAAFLMKKDSRIS